MVMRKGEAVRPEAERRKIGRNKLNEEYLQAKAKAEQLKGSASEAQAAELADHQTTAARLRLEAFDYERDVTGAWKGDFYGRDLNRIHQDLDDGQGGLDKARAERMHVIQVNMGELERLNKVGGHDLGDKALTQTCEKLYASVEAAIRGTLDQADQEKDTARSHFEIYRSGGNDFSIILKDLDQATAARVEEAIGKWMQVDGLPEGEALPVATNRLDLGEIVDMWDEAKKASGATDESRLFVDLIKDQSQISNDIEKSELRVERFRQILERMPEKEAQDFYDEYLKKSLGMLFRTDPKAKPMEFLEFRQAMESNKENLLDSAIKQALRDYKTRSAAQRDLAINVSNLVLNREKQRRTLSGLKQDELVASVFRETGPKSPESEKTEDKNEFLSRYKMTEGEKILGQYETEVRRLEALSASDPKDEAAKARLEVARARLYAESVKRDRATGLYERGVFFRKNEQAMSEGRPVSIVAIDMAFLKYFDREGGRETGNAAIKTAARILEEVLAQLPKELQAQAFRVGGDEFALSLLTDDPEDLEDIKHRIRARAQEAVIPTVDKGHSDRYKPESINFNFGTCTAKKLDSFRSELESSGFKLKYPAESPESVKEITDILVRIADRESELEKAVHRFMFLIDRELGESAGQSHGNLECLEEYSMKAIGGEDGLNKVREKAETIKKQIDEGGDRGQLMQSMQNEITQYVIDNGLLEISQQIERGEFVDKLLEMKTRQIYLTRRIESLEKQLDGKQQELDKQKQKNAGLEGEVVQLREEYAQLVALRQKLAA